MTHEKGNEELTDIVIFFINNPAINCYNLRIITIDHAI